MTKPRAVQPDYLAALVSACILGAIGVVSTIGCVVIAYQRKPLPGLLGAIVTSTTMVLGQIAHRYISATKVKSRKQDGGETDPHPRT